MDDEFGESAARIYLVGIYGDGDFRSSRQVRLVAAGRAVPFELFRRIRRLERADRPIQMVEFVVQIDFNLRDTLALKMVEKLNEVRRLGKFRHELDEGAFLSVAHAFPARGRHLDGEIIAGKMNHEIPVDQRERGRGDGFAATILLEYIGHRLLSIG